MRKKKVILAYSGGLDTSCCVQWLKDKGFEVICFSANLGSEFSPQDLKKRALKTGASKIYIKDLRKEFAQEYILPCLKSGAVYQNKYVLSTALGRPLIAKYLVDIAKKENASFVSHGCSAKGNDQVRIDLTVMMLAPRLKIIAPLREWGFTSRQMEIEYAKKKKIPIKTTKEKPYSIDKNIWGISVEAGVLEDLAKEPPEHTYILVNRIENTPDKPDYVEIEFAKGVPVKLNGRKMDFVLLIERLNKIGAKHGIGRTDLIENRTVGIKSREIYEAPGAWILHFALQEIENLVLDREALDFKRTAAEKYANLVYQGLWFSALKKGLDAFVWRLMDRVSGKVRLKLFKGNISVVSRYSGNSLYKKSLATYGEKDQFNRSWAEGFINIWGMPYKR